jgi:PTH1 family peptidyl-tRNA hydrolase
MYYIVGLGNPGKEYEFSRHNAGRIGLEDFLKNLVGVKIDEMPIDKKLNALVSDCEINGEKARIILPETFMNKSGDSLKPLASKIVKKKKSENLIVIHDDIDIALGGFKISFGKSSGGHKGVESIIKNIKTKDFIRIRVGISPLTPSGKIKKTDSKKIIDFIIGNFKPKELQIIKTESKKITSAIEIILKEGMQKAMNLHN